jgi:putative lipoprotein
MSRPRVAIRAARSAVLFAFVVSPTMLAQAPPRSPQSVNLAGTAWQLVRFQGGNGATRVPDVRSNYTISFGADGRVAARIDCNSGSGTWTSAGSSQLTFGPLVTTRVACRPGSLYNQIARNWQYVRSYTMRNGHLFLSLMADGGTYEFEPITTPATSARSVSGTATYRERIALPQNAVFEATLEDVSRAGTASELIARVRNEQPGNAPIPFTIAYDGGRIIPSHSYVVRARIVVGDQLWFTTDRNYPVLTGGNSSEVQLLLGRSSGQGSPPRIPSSPPLENTYWKLTYLGSTPVVANSTNREPNFVLHPNNSTVSGSGGCNGFSGSYTLNGDRVSFGRLLSTMMACVSGMETERAFLPALAKVRRWRISGQNLDLLDDRGNSLARFEAGYSR